MFGIFKNFAETICADQERRTISIISKRYSNISRSLIFEVLCQSAKNAKTMYLENLVPLYGTIPNISNLMLILRGETRVSKVRALPFPRVPPYEALYMVVPYMSTLPLAEQILQPPSQCKSHSSSHENKVSPSQMPSESHISATPLFTVLCSLRCSSLYLPKKLLQIRTT